MHNKTINIGILAHVDAGKTTITEQILFQSGSMRAIGSVDKGTSATDNLKVEQERGISIRLATATFTYNNTKVNIIDTPGHVDFCAEVEYSLRALDAAVLVVSAAEGVQGHTISLFNAIKQMQIPCLIFINKIDRVGADIKAIMLDINKNLSKHTVLLQQLNGDEIEPLWSKDTQNAELIEQILEYDDELMEKYLDGDLLSFQQLNDVLIRSITKTQLIPVLMGAAKNGLGINKLLDAVTGYFRSPDVDKQKSLSAVVFKIEHDNALGKMCYLRVFSGQIKPRDVLVNASRKISKDQKVGQLKSNNKGKYSDIQAITAGDIGIASGLSEAKVGDIYGCQGNIPEMFSLSSPMLKVQIKPQNDAQIMDLVQGITQLTDEDPMLGMQWLPDLRELHIKITGMIQVEILQAVLKERYGLAVEFSEPSVIYKETPKTVSYGYERYWMPKPCWAILKLKIEPATLGSGVHYKSEISVNDVATKYQKEIEQTIPKALEQGIKGWQVTDCKITLVEGEDHNVHSRSGDFIIATPMAIMNGLSQSGTTLLEPILTFYISASIELLGAITSDITKMRGSFDSPQMDTETFTITGTIPASTSMKYPIKLASISGSKAKISTKLKCYQPCTDEQGQTTNYRGINPLDRDKWILQARKAL